MTQDDHDTWTERAAIMEFDGGLARPDADRYAWALLFGSVQE